MQNKISYEHIFFFGIEVWMAFLDFFTVFVARNTRFDQILSSSVEKTNIANILPDVLLENIGNRLTLANTLAWHSTCRTIKSAVGEACNYRIQKQYDTVMRHFPLYIIRSVPMAIWFELEWIDYNPKWMGSTDYIDNIEPADISGNPFRCCYDTYGRLALILRRENDVAVLFQRHTDKTQTWAFASKTLPIGGCRLSDSMVARLALQLSHPMANRFL